MNSQRLVAIRSECGDGLAEALSDTLSSTVTDLDRALSDVKAGKTPQAPKNRDERTERAATARHQYKLLEQRWRTYCTLIEHLTLTDRQGRAAHRVVKRRSRGVWGQKRKR